MYKVLSILLLAALLAACATGQIVKSDVHAGMSKQQVVAVLGKPDGFRQSGDYQALEYANRLISGWSWDRADYYVILKDDKVISYGPGNVRQESPNSNVLILVPLR